MHADSESYLLFAYQNLAPVLAAAMQEQQAEIEALRAENQALRAALEADRTATHTRLASLERLMEMMASR